MRYFPFFAMFLFLAAATQAEQYSKTMQSAVATKPVDFLVNGRTVAGVTGTGSMFLRDATLTQTDAVALRAWIASQFMEGNPK